MSESPFRNVVRALAFVMGAKVVIWAACYLGSGDASWLNAFHKWDSYWYEGIASAGYEDGSRLMDPMLGQSNWAFFPLYPLLVSILGKVLSIDPAWSMEVLSWPIAMGCLLALRALFSAHGLHEQKDFFVFLCWPFGLFLFVHYSDALYLALACTSLLAIGRNRLGIAALCLALLVLTRPNGLFFVPVGLLYYTARHPVMGKERWSVAEIRSAGLLLIAPAVSFAAWCAYQWHATGDAFAFSTAQAGWGRRWSWPWESLFNSGGFAPQFESWYTLVLLIASGWYWRRLEWSFRVWLVLGIVVPMCSGSVDSMTRFSIAFVPLMLMVAKDLAQRPRVILFQGVLLVFHLLCLTLWATYHPLMA